jgi:hypothetical protein
MRLLPIPTLLYQNSSVLRPSEPVDSYPQPVPVPMDNEGTSHPIAKPPFSSIFRSGASVETLQLPRQPSTLSAMNEPLAASVSRPTHSKRAGGTGKFVSPTGISVAATILTWISTTSCGLSGVYWLNLHISHELMRRRISSLGYNLQNTS